MTLILSAFIGGYAYQLSDRQTSRMGRVDDRAWNKTVLVLSELFGEGLPTRDPNR
jgi:hypothetical protein